MKRLGRSNIPQMFDYCRKLAMAKGVHFHNLIVLGCLIFAQVVLTSCITNSPVSTVLVVSPTITTSSSSPTSLPLPTPTYTLARQFGLPIGYAVTTLFEPPVKNLNHMARSENGVIYLRSIGDEAGFSVLDVNTKKILKFIRIHGQMHFPFGGPGDTIFVGVNDEVWQVYPDGSHDVWGLRSEAWPRFYTNDGRMLGSNGDSVVEMFPSGRESLIADGFTEVFDIVANKQGIIFVSDFISGDLVRIDLNGESRTLIEGMIYRDEINLTLSPDGQLYLNCVNVGFVRVDTETGTLTRFANINGDVAFSATNEVLFTDASQSQVYRLNLISGTQELIVHNRGLYTRAVAIGPDDSLYVGMWGHEGVPARVVRFLDNGTQEIVIDGLSERVHDIAFDKEGGLYVVSKKNDRYQIFYKPPDRDTLVTIPGSGGSSAIAVDPKTGHVWASVDGGRLFEYSLSGLITEHWIQFPKEPHEFYIDFAPDGTLYAFSFERERATTGPEVDRWILRLNPEDGSSEIIAQHNRQGCCTFGNLGVDIYGTIWWVLNPEFEIYRVSAGGEITLFAQNLPTDPAAIIADSEGDVYFTSPAGIIRIFRENDSSGKSIIGSQ